MPLPDVVSDRLLIEDDVVGLKFNDGAASRVYYFKACERSFPVNLRDYSLGSITAMATAGSGWDAVQDSSSNNYLEPEDSDYINQGFFGVSPSYLRVFLRYPGNVDRLNLRGIRTVGGQVGYIDGRISPYVDPSCATEFFTVKEINPNFNGYHPYPEPSTVTGRMNFFINKVAVDYLGQTDSNGLAVPGKKAPTGSAIGKGRVVTMGGADSLIRTPDWIREKA